MRYVLFFIIALILVGCDLGTSANDTEKEMPKQQLYYLEHGQVSNGAKQIIASCQKAKCMYEATKTYPTSTFPYQNTTTREGVNSYLRNLGIEPNNENIWLIVDQTGGTFLQYTTVENKIDYIFIIVSEKLSEL